MTRILWIDPGTTTIGFSLIEKEGSRLSLIDFWILSTTPKIDIPLKLLEIGNDIKAIIAQYRPDILSIEKLYFTKNITTGIDVSQARGVVVYEAMKAWLQIFEYTPLQVKRAITGNGKANKLQLQRAIQMIFRLDSLPKPDDAADAIGLGYMGALENTKLQISN